LTDATISIKPGDEFRSTMTGSCHQNLTSSPSHQHDRANNKSQVAGRGEQGEQDQNSDRLPRSPSLSKSLANSKVENQHLEKTQTLPVLKPNQPYLNPIETIPGLPTGRSIRPSGSSGESERPVSGSSDQFSTSQYFPLPTTVSTPPKPQSAKKTRISAGKALKNSFSKFTKPFGRRSDVTTSASPLKMTKSISDEHIPTTAYANRAEASNLPKVPSVMNARALSPSIGPSKSKKPNKHGNGVPEYQFVTPVWLLRVFKNCPSFITSDVFPAFFQDPFKKKNRAGSISSRPSYQHLFQQGQHQQQTPRRDSAATSGAGSEAHASSSSPHVPLQPNSGNANPPSGTGVGAMPFANIIDVLYGINMPTTSSGHGGSTLFPLPRSVTVGGTHPATHSCGGSTQSGGDARGSLNGGGGVVTSAGGGQLQQQGIIGGPTPPVYNVAMALALMCQRTQSLMDAQAEAQLKMTAEIKEELIGLRSDLTETRNIVNTLTVEVDALRRDMQTKEEVANQKLGDTVAKLEQLDASAEKLRQNVQQDLITIRNEQKHALEPLKYQLATETRDLRDMFTTLSNKVAMLEKCERLSNLDRDQPRLLQSIANTMIDLFVSLLVFITTLVQMLIRFLNAGATVTNNRYVLLNFMLMQLTLVILYTSKPLRLCQNWFGTSFKGVLNVCIMILLLFLFLPDSIARWWGRADGNDLNQYPYSPPSLPPR
uniref:Liprin-beta n=1 Tax=Rodentolepis nana TaxID=102285 RepID=A0A0R3TWB5_RODNA